MTIKSPGKKPFTIKTTNNSVKNIYVHSAKLNGVLLKGVHIPFSEIHKGGNLLLEMGD
ncbi:glycoside hydrolase domain-containing protein [Pedobacter sp. CG_S7]|uniref:glycoside hydrolase domain-containing protein n=1 Tax=Pedobacter sp. CG_S7 TaxID=3143930 RepID=UPI003397FFB4